ncbi:MAG: class C sortase [Oscillospiraceae bacterium]|nr:class C sortase [Oscillospiraceae bacterium]
MQNNKKAVILAAILLLVSLGITIYPLIANALAEKYRSEIQTKYFEKIESMDTTEIDEAWKEAEKYNRLLTSGVVQNNFSDEALDLANVGYEAILNLNADGIMGYIEIPRTDTYLPISHGTEAETLEKAVGHVIGSSLPIGGEGTHSVLSGHSGMSDQKMFSDLEDLHLGDIFYLHVLNETLAYKVTSIDTVLPEDTSLLGIEPDKDMVTLVTCTPFGVNTHRLLVRGERTDYEEAVVEVEEMIDAVDTQSAWTRQYYRGILIGIAGLCFLLTIYGMIQTKGDGWN